MSELEQIFLTSGLTILGGIFVFLISQSIYLFVILPIKRHKEVITEIDTNLRFYANVITNPITLGAELFKNPLVKKQYFECHNTLRKLSCELETSYRQRPFKNKDYGKKVISTVSLLTALSNSLSTIEGINVVLENSKRIDEIRKLLNIPSLAP